MDLTNSVAIYFKVSLPTFPSLYLNSGNGQRSHHDLLYEFSFSFESKANFSLDGMRAKCSIKAIGIKGRSSLMENVSPKGS